MQAGKAGLGWELAQATYSNIALQQYTCFSIPSFNSPYLKAMYCTTLQPWGPRATCKHARGPQGRSLPLD